MKIMLKKYFSLLIIILFICIPITSLAAEEVESIKDVTRQQLTNYDISGLAELFNLLEDTDRFNDRTLSDVIVDFATGNMMLDSENVLKYIFEKMLVGIKEILSGMSLLLFTVVLCGLIKNFLTDSFGNVKDVYEYIAFITVSALLLSTFTDYVELTNNLLKLTQSFIRAIFPPLITLMTAMGGISSASVFQPVILFLGSGMFELMTNVVLPISVICGVSGIVSGISNRIKLEEISSFFASLNKWILGISSTVFVGVVSMQGMMAATYDGISMKTAKYTVDNTLPIVGGLMSDTMDTVVGCSLLLKNAIGVTGLIIIGGLCIVPLIKYVNGIITYKLMGALLCTITDSRMNKSISGLVSAVTGMFAIVCVVLAMTFIIVALAINACNTNVMLR